MYKFLVIVLFSCLFSQTTGKLSGSVGDLDKNPLYGVNVIVQDTYYGAASDDNGLFYIINIPPGQYTVRFDIIGYKSIEVQDVSISVNKTTRLDVDLEEDTDGYDEQEVNPTREKVKSLMDSIFENRTDIPEGLYIEICDRLKKIS